MSFTTERLGWDDLEIFFHVAEGGGLSAASRIVGLSPPTVGRRMLALERRAGQKLFNRAQTGYSLTQTGQSLLQRVRVMHAAAVPAEDVLLSQVSAPLVRLSAGTATAKFLADKYNLLSRPMDGFRLNLVTTEATLDIAHREIDLGIRNRAGEAGNVASRKLGTICFAPYRNWSVRNPEQLGWVALDPVHARHPAAHWLHRQNHPIAAMASTVATVHDLVKAGAGIGIMPCMIGDCDPTLCRSGPIVEDLTEQQYLVMHDDDRHRPAIRTLIQRIATIYLDNADLLAGQRPLRGEASG